uniref:Uncharacterized protein n=1 Tax=Nelumbo nucifera TaxID=4432 RepID=A0A822YTS9_NELNU|nr:TPA_asm: hypothetical protein HUJ06_006153 [Nelumbo nucifera]
MHFIAAGEKKKKNNLSKRGGDASLYLICSYNLGFIYLLCKFHFVSV